MTTCAVRDKLSYGTIIALVDGPIHPTSPTMPTQNTTTPAEVSTFLENFVIAVDFQKPVEVIETTPLANLPEWDSLAALGVIVMCDTEYGVAITGPDLASCSTVGDIYSCVVRKRGG